MCGGRANLGLVVLQEADVRGYELALRDVRPHRFAELAPGSESQRDGNTKNIHTFIHSQSRETKLDTSVNLSATM